MMNFFTRVYRTIIINVLVSSYAEKVKWSQTHFILRVYNVFQNVQLSSLLNKDGKKFF